MGHWCGFDKIHMIWYQGLSHTTARCKFKNKMLSDKTFSFWIIGGGVIIWITEWSASGFFKGLLHRSTFGCLWNTCIRFLKILWKMEHLLLLHFLLYFHKKHSYLYIFYNWNFPILSKSIKWYTDTIIRITNYLFRCNHGCVHLDLSLLLY